VVRVKHVLPVIAVLFVATGCIPPADVGGEGKPCTTNGACLEGLSCDPADSICKKPGTIDGGLLAPVISGIDGDGTESPVACPDAGPCAGIKAQHRFRKSWVISGLRLDTVSNTELKGSKTYGPADGLKFEDGGTAMQRKLLLPISLAAGLFTLTLTNAAGDATAETYILQGEKGDPGTFTGSFTGDVTFTGNMNLTGTATLNNLVVQNTYQLPDCPEGYTKDARTDITLCKKGADEIVKVGDFWIDKYEPVIVDSTQYAEGRCDGAGVPYGQSSYNYPSAFPRTGNWTGPMYACSIYGVKPSAYMTWFQAQEACALSGKELCTNEQWQAAAAGTYDTTGTETGTQCHIKSTNTSARNTGLAGSTPGGTDSCMSKWGTEDMIGNLSEWVSFWGQGGPDSSVSAGGYAGNVSTGNPGFALFSPETTGDGDGTWNIAGTAYGCDKSGGNCEWKVGQPFAALRGGNLDDGPRAGVFALELTYGPSYPVNSVGFRCCRGR
jgi:formylglycine-generating enzyme required for sulfatase activity